MTCTSSSIFLRAKHTDDAFRDQRLDLNPTYAEVKLAYDNVEKWIKPQSAPFGMNWFAMKPRLVAEAKGVVLIISPFNVPIFLTITPLVSFPIKPLRCSSLLWSARPGRHTEPSKEAISA